MQGNLRHQRQYIAQLLDRLTDDYLALKPEIEKIAAQYPGSEDEFAFVEEFELLITSICGYAKQIQATGAVKQFDAAVAHLHALQVFAGDAMAQFYAEARLQYPKLHAYLQSLDYLRLIVLEYLQMQQTMQPISAWLRNL